MQTLPHLSLFLSLTHTHSLTARGPNKLLCLPQGAAIVDQDTCHSPTTEKPPEREREGGKLQQFYVYVMKAWCLHTEKEVGTVSPIINQ